jgi:hypothetical protein
LGTLQKDIAEIERMLKALIKSSENKHLNPWPLESLAPLLQLNWRRTLLLDPLLQLNWRRTLLFFHEKSGLILEVEK